MLCRFISLFVMIACVIVDSYRFTWPEGEFAVSGQSYEYTKDELNNVRFDSGHEER